MVLYVRIK